MVISTESRTQHGAVKYLEKAASSMTTELSTNSKLREVYKSTCENCTFRGERSEEQDWISISTGPLENDRRFYEVGKFPVRCTPCDTKSRRYSRMGATLRKIREVKDNIVKGKKFARPKMITIGNSESLDKKEFQRRLKIFHKECAWVIGGTFVLELGTKPMGDYAGMWHSHGVYIAPYIDEEKLEDFCIEVRKYGICLNNYKEAKIDQNYIDSDLKNYIAKYMCKDGGRKQSVGALLNCVHHELILTDGSIKKIWKQPNKKYQKQMKLWITSLRD